MWVVTRECFAIGDQLMDEYGFIWGGRIVYVIITKTLRSVVMGIHNTRIADAWWTSGDMLLWFQLLVGGSRLLVTKEPKANARS